MKYTINDVGCYVDGHKGIYVGRYIQKIAESHGWNPDDGLVLDTCHTSYDSATDEAIDYMNEVFSVEGACWQWNDGDFGLYEIEDN